MGYDPETTARFSVYLPRWAERALAADASRRGLSKGAVLREIVLAVLAQRDAATTPTPVEAAG